LAHKVHNSTTTFPGDLVYFGLLMSVMRPVTFTNNPELTEAIFYVCTATIVGSLARIITAIW